MDNKGDVWISTVLYTLIGLAIVGSLIAIIQPKVSEYKDRIIIDNTQQSLNLLDNTVTRTREATGTRLNYILKLDKGNFIIDGKNEIISWQAESKYRFSEENQTINLTFGNLKAATFSQAGGWNVTLILDYRGYGLNLTVNGANDVKTLSASSMPYSIWITNRGIQNKVQQIDFSVD